MPKQARTKTDPPHEVANLRRRVAELEARLGGMGKPQTDLDLDTYLMNVLLENIPDSVFFKNKHGRYMRVNKALAHKHEIDDPLLLLGKSDFDFFTAEQAQATYDIERDIMRSGKSVLNIEVEEHWSNRPTTWALVSKLPLVDGSGAIIGVFGIARDISKRKVAEIALKESEERFRSILENANEGILIVNVENQCIFFSNAKFRLMTGYNEEELAAFSIRDLHTVDDLPHVLDQFDKLVHREIEIARSIPVKCKHGELIYTDISTALITIDKQPYITGFFRDIGERLTHERELQVIVKLSQALRSAQSHTEMTPIILGQIMHLLNPVGALLELVEPASGDVVIAFATGAWEAMTGIRMTPDQSQDTYIMAKGKLYLNVDVRSDPEVLFPQLFTTCQIVTGVPMIAHEQVIGFVWVGLSTALGDGDMRLLSTIADIAGNAIRRTTLHEETQRSAVALANAYEATIEGWSRALDLRDKETEGHTMRVTEITEKLAHAMGIAEAELLHIRRGALLHDIGKMGVPDSILFKPGKLTDEEWVVMRRHPELAYDMLSPIAYLRPALDIPHFHHEKWDGSGYPQQLQGEAIPLVARIFAVVDVWDALTSDRPYRPAWTKEKALEYICGEAGKHFDPHVVEVFLKMIIHGEHT